MKTATASALLLVGALAVALGACKGASDEDQIKALVRRAVDAANEKSVSGVVKDALPDFKGPNGVDLAESRRIMVGYFMQQGWIRVFERGLDVEVKGDAATAKLATTLARGNPVEKLEDVIPTNADVLDFELTLRKTGGAWKIASARYQRSQ